MKRTIIIRRDYLHYIKKYQRCASERCCYTCTLLRPCACSLKLHATSYSARYEKRHKNVPVHMSPAFRVKEGDKVVVGQCRPLSKTVRFNVLKVIPMGSKLGAKGKGFSSF